MSEHEAEVRWQRASDEKFIDKRYSRVHSWQFDGGVTVPASSSPHAVKIPYSKPENVDPEEALVAAIASCHMLSFLWVAAKAGFVVDSYHDPAVGYLKRNQRGREAVTNVTLRPAIAFSGLKAPSEEDVQHLHHEAHEECYIANSVLTEIAVLGSWTYAQATSE